METLILLIMGTCILGMVIQFLQKEVTGKVFGYAAMFLFIHICASMLAGFLADEGLLTVQKLMSLSQILSGILIIAISIKYYLQLRKKAKNE
ncbi:hypothetical protein U1299_00505 [Enterococcus cecorum]|uniref:Uncharacterized protein n=2 Tax=Enterococcus cecorum TaxID=44008 RepID=A0A1Y4R3F1_9ENTE|nr:hypothetical protein [Enterococcus cecorum]KLN93145.1 hypothetical protein ABT59_05090 [Enterococcus cecorum]KLN93417.1 hypothetical protein ABT60_06175 [Enterococcus cecorum]KLO65929.1 hypothetical protein AA985_06880 [Enterococcus cecorum]MCJ0521516.1 hypothetical protein [Enterococcus cecorum]MCJ0535319.1 hypothetical protein [Enterococcus cecorum]